MEGGARLRDREALRALRAAVHSFSHAAGEASESALGRLDRASAEARESLDSWRARRTQAEQAMRQAAADLDSCLSLRRADCSRQARALDEAKAWLERCEENVSEASRCCAMLDQAARRFHIELSRFRLALQQDVAAAASFLGTLAIAADAYAGMPAVSGGPGEGGPLIGSPPSGGGDTVGAPEEPRIGSTEAVVVDLSRIDLGDSPVRGPGDFSKVSHATMRAGVQRLDEVVLPAVERGADRDYFSRLDESLGLDYEDGNRRIFDAFFGTDSLRLDARPDGSYGVTNGYHRIHVARELGLSTLPARVSPWRGPA